MDGMLVLALSEADAKAGLEIHEICNYKRI